MREDIVKLIALVDEYLSSEEFTDTLSALGVIYNVNEELVFGAVNRPDYLEPLITAFEENTLDELYQDCIYDFSKFKLALDVLLYDIICSVAEDGKQFKVTTGVKVILEEELKSAGISLQLLETNASNIEDYICIIDYALGIQSENEQKEEVDEDNKESTGSDKVEENGSSIWDDMLQVKVQSVLSVYKELYEVGYQVFTPVGILYERGIVKHTKDGNRKEENVLLQGIFESINNKVGKIFSTSRLPNGNCKPKLEYVNNGCYYFPNYQMRNIFGIDSTDSTYTSYISSLKERKIVKYTQLEKYLEKEVFDILRTALRDVSKYSEKPLTLVEANRVIEPIICALETVIVVTEYNKGTNIKLKVSTGGKFILNETAFINDIQGGRIFGSSTEIEQFVYNNGVYTINFVMDRKKYDGFPLFAFQALEAVKKNGRPEWGSVVLGKNMLNDTILRRGFNANTDFLISLIAGSRSGKGVTTLNLLASAMGAGYPIFYQDFKPDMSSTLYNLAAKNGTETFAFDGSWESKEFGRRADIFYDADNVPQELIDVGFDVKEFALLVSYFRAMELTVNIARLRQKAVNNNFQGLEELGGERLVFVFDEIELFSIKYRDMFETFNKIDGRVNTMIANLTRGMKPAEKQSYAPYLYIEDFKSWATSVVSAFSACMSATFGQSKITIFMIWQHTDLEKFGMPMRNLSQSIINNSIRIVGNGTLSGNGSKNLGAMNYKGTEYEKYFSQYCFAIANQRGGEITPENSIIFKPYLLLNEVAPQYINELLSRCPDVREIIEVDGQIREDVAFEGYVKRLLETDNIAPILGKSWNIAQRVVRDYGLDRDLISYMYNLHDFRLKRVGSKTESQEYFSDENYNNDFNTFENNQDFMESEFSESDNEYINKEAEYRDNISQKEGIFNMPTGNTKEPERYSEYIFKHNLYNITEESFMNEANTTESLNNLAITLYAHIMEIIGEDRVVSVAEKDRYLIINNILIAPRVTKEIVEKLPYDVRSEVSDGRLASVFVFGYTRHFKNLAELIFSDARFLTMKVLRDYGIRSHSTTAYEDCIKELFKIHKNLMEVYIGNERITREDIENIGANSKMHQEFERASRSNDIDQELRRQAPKNNYKWGISSFYRNPDISFNKKAAATVGIGALALLACTNPVGLLAVGYAGGKVVVNGTVTLASKIKNGFKAFKEAFKDSL